MGYRNPWKNKKKQKKWVKFDAHTWKKRFVEDTWSKFDFCSLGLLKSFTFVHSCPCRSLIFLLSSPPSLLSSPNQTCQCKNEKQKHENRNFFWKADLIGDFLNLKKSPKNRDTIGNNRQSSKQRVFKCDFDFFLSHFCSERFAKES